MNLANSRLKFLAAIAGAAALAGCDSIKSVNEQPAIPRPAQTVVINGSVSGLSATRPVELTMVTTNNGLNDGTKTFAFRGTEILKFGAVNVGANYNITISKQPVGRVCTLQNGSGVATADVSNVTVACVRDDTPLVTLTASIAGALAADPPEGFAVTLTTEEGSETINPTAGQTSVTFTLPIYYPRGLPTFNYAVTATNTVGGTKNNCSVTNGTGQLIHVEGATEGNITNVSVASCLYTISAVAQYAPPPGGANQAMGAGGLQLGLRNQLTDEIVVEAPLINAYSGTAVAFPGTFASHSGALYEVVVLDHPDGQFCIVQGGGMAQLVTSLVNVTAQVRCRNVPAAENQLKGVFQRDTPAIREVAAGDDPPGSVIPEPRVQTRDFLAFFPNGTFIHGTHRATATAGVEHGFYDYNPGADTLSFSILTDTNGGVGSINGRNVPAVAACGYTFSIPFPGGAPCVNSPTQTFGPLADFPGCGGTCTVTAPAYVDVLQTSSQSAGLSGTVAGVPARLNFNGTSFNFAAVTQPLTATEVQVTPGAPGVAGTLSMRFGAEGTTNRNPVWTMTEPVSTAGQIQGSWVTADSKRVFVYNKTTFYGFHAGVNGAPNLQDACFTIVDATRPESYYSRRGGDTGCMAATTTAAGGDPGDGLTNVGTVDVPNATTTNLTAPLIPGFAGRLPGSISNAVVAPSPIRYKVTAGSPDTLSIQNTLNDIPVGDPVIFTRATTY